MAFYIPPLHVSRRNSLILGYLFLGAFSTRNLVNPDLAFVVSYSIYYTFSSESITILVPIFGGFEFEFEYSSGNPEIKTMCMVQILEIYNIKHWTSSVKHLQLTTHQASY